MLLNYHQDGQNMKLCHGFGAYVEYNIELWPIFKYDMGFSEIENFRLRIKILKIVYTGNGKPF